MMDKIIEYVKKLLADGENNPSSMRAMSFIALGAGIIIAFVGLYKGSDLSALAVLAGVFVGSAFAGKVAQSNVENKGNS